ncbi:MAG: RNA methyltransferase [Opitutaceae bacterium]|nr:RNA methyltransferase [Opitutaceae bacterium]
MAQFSQRDSGYRPRPRPGFARDEFVAPASASRARGETPAPRRAVVSAAPDGLADSTRTRPAFDELKLCGLAAVRARFARDPQSILRLFFDEPTGQRVGAICKALAQAKRIYRQVEPAELEKIAGSIHHGGIVAVVRAPVLQRVTAAEITAWASAGAPVLLLDRIGNAHNLGAIARTTAFFGVPRIVIPDTATAARPSDSAHRVAEGGFEQVEVWLAQDLTALVRELAAAGYEVIGTATRGATSLRTRPKRDPEAPRKPVAIVLGNEEQGLAPDLAAACSRLVTIPGTGKIESLNVSVAAGVLLWELVMRRGQ